ncbi:MAG TPA: hypothetical protein VFK41_03935 [Nocardioidaceae bacterium]|nr:hypothetical protein [Nocardioidaceae bacterium]
MDNTTPSLLPPHQMPPVRSQADLELYWRRLMGELGFGSTLLWWTFFDADGFCAPPLQQLEDLPEVPEEPGLTNLMWICQQVIDEVVPGGSVAFLRSRPGGAGITAADHAWASGIARAARTAGVRCHPVHLANDHELRVFAPDDEIAGG